MNPPKVNEYDYIDFLIGIQQVYSCTEAARVQPEDEKAMDELRYRPLLEGGKSSPW